MRTLDHRACLRSAECVYRQPRGRRNEGRAQLAPQSTSSCESRVVAARGEDKAKSPGDVQL